MWASATLRHIDMHTRFTCICTIAVFTGFERENDVREFQPLLIILDHFIRKPSAIWLCGDSCIDNSLLMLAPCHSYFLTPSAPLGVDRLIGSYCSTSESEEGKLWPLPCSLASLFHFTACFSWAPSLNFLLFNIISLLFYALSTLC